jgi:hypothetical protein
MTAGAKLPRRGSDSATLWQYTGRDGADSIRARLP